MEQTENISPASNYESNPFLLAFSALGRFFKHNLAWAIVLIVLAVLTGAVQFAGNAVETYNTQQSEREQTSLQEDSLTVEPSTNHDVPALIAIFLGVVVVVAVVFLVSSAIGVLVQGVLVHVALQSEAGKSVGFGEAVQASANKFGIYYLSFVLASLKIFGWYLLLIVPGIIATFRYALLPYVVMSDGDKKYPKVADVHKRTKELVKGRLSEVFGVAFVSGIIPIIGRLLNLGGSAALHNQMAHYHDSNIEKPQVHWLNYLLIALTVTFFVGMLVLVLLLILFALSSSFSAV